MPQISHISKLTISLTSVTPTSFPSPKQPTATCSHIIFDWLSYYITFTNRKGMGSFCSQVESALKMLFLKGTISIQEKTSQIFLWTRGSDKAWTQMQTQCTQLNCLPDFIYMEGMKNVARAKNVSREQKPKEKCLPLSDCSQVCPMRNGCSSPFSQWRHSSQASFIGRSSLSPML